MPSWTHWLSSLTGTAAPVELASTPCDVAALREHILALLHDCDGADCEHLRTRLQRARTASDLWNARSDLFSVVAHRHCEWQAAQRVNALAPLFAGTVADRLLRPLPGYSAAE
ncbi:hypothetical protein [Ramlibacter sp. PS4R-6]|uniref:hypothetical protein n=1 Tax=Ramlibacter sp. PS4R-6 TaxID=3133438 RepID=UPI0030A76602